MIDITGRRRPLRFPGPIAILAAALVLTIVLRLPAFFQPAWYGDEGIFAAVARAVREGGALYAEAWDNKPPGIFAVYLLGEFAGGMVTIRFVALGATLATQVLLFAMALRASGPKVAGLVAVVFGLLVGLPIIEGHLANTETFMLLPIAGGMYVLQQRARGDDRWVLLAGVLMGTALLFKQVAVFEAAAGFAFLALASPRWRTLAAYILGTLALPVLAAAIFAALGTLDTMIFATVGSLGTYAGDSPSRPIGVRALPLLPAAIALAFALRARAGDRASPTTLHLLWVAAASLGTTASGRSYPHYLIELAAPAALLTLAFGRGIAQGRPDLSYTAAYAASAASVMLIYHSFFGPWGHVAWNEEPARTVDYYVNFVGRLDGSVTEDRYEAFFDKHTPSRLRLANELATLELGDRELFVWGDDPWLYPLADLRNPLRYPTLFQAIEIEDGPDGVASLLLRERPDRVVVLDTAASTWWPVAPLVGLRYDVVRHFEGATLLERTDLREMGRVAR